MKNKNDLISICLVWENASLNNLSINLENLCNSLSEEFDFFEVILLIHEKDFKAYKNILPHKNNLRFIILKTFDDHYAKRTICAREAIGDIVVISDINEITAFNFNKLINTALETESIVITKSQKLPLFERIFSYPFLFLGKIIGLEINIGVMKTIVFPRTQINMILSQDYVDLKLRFPPSNLNFYASVASPSRIANKTFSGLKSKFSLIYKLLLNLTPVLLRQLTLFSGLGIFISLTYFLYAIGVYILAEEVQSGWLTLSLSISGTALFLTSATFILSIGIQHMLYSYDKKNDSSSLYEIEPIDLYKNVKDVLNIELNNDEQETKNQKI